MPPSLSYITRTKLSLPRSGLTPLRPPSPVTRFDPPTAVSSSVAAPAKTHSRKLGMTPAARRSAGAAACCAILGGTDASSREQGTRRRSTLTVALSDHRADGSTPPRLRDRPARRVRAASPGPRLGLAIGAPPPARQARSGRGVRAVPHGARPWAP